MVTIRRPMILLAVLMLVLSASAFAEVFTVELTNGNTIETRYRPEISGWDENKVVLITQVGNRITLHKEDIAGVEIESEVKGYGTRINTTTIFMGLAPNDKPTPEEMAAMANDPANQMKAFLQEQNRQRPNYTVDQFVEPGEAGTGGGLPAWDFGPGAFAGRNEPTIVPVRPRTPSPPPARGNDGGQQ